MSKRILGLDFGSKTVGVAVSDPTGLIASGVEIIRREREDKLRQTLSRIEELVKEYDVEEIVMGLPVNMNNTKGERVEKTMAFKEMLERRIGLPVNLWDERLTTVEADEIMTEVGVKGRQDRKKYVDKIAAMIILQDYMDNKKQNQE
ncbi:MAG: Holliday junction resolvase RuvX [Lachnospiraceae bacterium]|nr:Holliday junction resolvase RuvX [Lachnospiraceae bacterium]